MTAHGLPGATGLLAWPDNYVYPQALSDVTSCFDFNRRYGSGVTTQSVAVQAPYAQSTAGFSGGPCHDQAAACYSLTFPFAVTRYRSPHQMLAKVTSAGPEQWVTLQVYLFVTGYEPGQWDCTRSSWTDHWTDDTERYCWNDFLSVISALPAGAFVTDPATVGSDWGRNAPGLPPAPPLGISGFTPASGSTGTLVTINGSGFTGANAVKFHGVSASFSVLSDAQISAVVPPTATSGTIRVVVGRQGVNSGTRYLVTPGT